MMAKTYRLWALTLPWDKTKLVGVYWFSGASKRPAFCATSTALFHTRREARVANDRRGLRAVRVDVTIEEVRR